VSLNVDTWADAMILASVPPATLGAILYLTTGPWWLNHVGRSLATAWSSIAILTLWIAAFVVFGNNFPYRDVLRDIVFTALFIGLTYKFVVIVGILYKRWRGELA
jgi:hypothetical protein